MRTLREAAKPSCITACAYVPGGIIGHCLGLSIHDCLFEELIVAVARCCGCLAMIVGATHSHL